jgi:hypothetical protein
MGLLKHLLFWPVTGPKFLIDFSLDRVQGVVKDELTDDNAVKAELMELQLLLELGDIDDAEYERREAELMQRLRDIRDWRERLGMGVSGGLVRVAGTGEDADELTGAARRPAGGAADDERAGASGGAGSGAAAAAAHEDEDAPRVADPGSATIDLNLDWD